MSERGKRSLISEDPSVFLSSITICNILQFYVRLSDGRLSPPDRLSRISSFVFFYVCFLSLNLTPYVKKLWSSNQKWAESEQTTPGFVWVETGMAFLSSCFLLSQPED